MLSPSATNVILSSNFENFLFRIFLSIVKIASSGYITIAVQFGLCLKMLQQLSRNIGKKIDGRFPTSV
jgi:hypothetical protein